MYDLIRSPDIQANVVIDEFRISYSGDNYTRVRHNNQDFLRHMFDRNMHIHQLLDLSPMLHKLEILLVLQMVLQTAFLMELP